MRKYYRYSKNITKEIDAIFSIAVRKEIEDILMKKAELKMMEDKPIGYWQKLKLFLLLLIKASF